MNIKIIASLLLCIFMLSCTSYQYVYSRELESVNINEQGDTIYTFSESEKTMRNGYVIHSMPSTYTSFVCPHGSEVSTETMMTNGRAGSGNLCHISRTFNQNDYSSSSMGFTDSVNYPDPSTSEMTTGGKIGIGFAAVLTISGIITVAITQNGGNR